MYNYKPYKVLFCLFVNTKLFFGLGQRIENISAKKAFKILVLEKLLIIFPESKSEFLTSFHLLNQFSK